MQSNILFVTADNPDKDQFLKKRQRSRLVYRQVLRDEEKREKTSYTSDLYDALLLKMVKDFGVGVQNLNHRSRVLRLTAASMNVLLSANSPRVFKAVTHTCTIIKVNQSLSWISMFVTSYTSWL